MAAGSIAIRWRSWLKALLFLPFLAVAVIVVGATVVISPYWKMARQVDLQFREPEFGAPQTIPWEYHSLDEVPEHLIQAVVVAQDPYLFESSAYVRYFFDGAGCSKILAAGLVPGRSYSRHLVVPLVAVRLERAYTESELLELFINHSYYGEGYVGIGQAAKGYYGKEVADLTREEAAVLAGVLSSPEYLSPVTNPEGAREAGERVQTLMDEQFGTP